MNDELMGLLKRVEAAGGPVTEVDERGTTACIHGLLKHARVTAFFGAWERLEDAHLIHTLQMDAVERGADFGLSFSQVEQEYKAVVFLPGGTMHEADDDAAAIAMTRAWLGAFEDSQ